jgi:hypothetical protein
MNAFCPLAFLLLSHVALGQVPTPTPRQKLATMQAPPNYQRSVQSSQQIPAIIPDGPLDAANSNFPKQDSAVLKAAPDWLKSQVTGQPTIVIDGSVATVAQVKKLKKAEVSTVTPIDAKRAVTMYGPNASRGLLILVTKAMARKIGH